MVDPGTSPNATVPIHSTKASNMYDFGVMAFQVRTDTFACYRSVRSLKIGSYGETSISLDEKSEFSNVLNGERESTLMGVSPRSLGFAAGYYWAMLVQKTLEAHIGQKGT